MQQPGTLEAGAQVPHFQVRATDGTERAYADVWQHENLVLVVLPEEPTAAARAYEAALHARWSDLTAHDTAVIVTRDAVAGVPRPGVVVADRWGEIHFVAADPVERLPTPDALVEWLRFIQVQCPECQGETR